MIDLQKDQTLNQEPLLCRTTLLECVTSYTFDLSGKQSGAICFYASLLACIQSCQECLHGQSFTVTQNKALWDSGRHVCHHNSHMLSIQVQKVVEVNDDHHHAQQDGQ